MSWQGLWLGMLWVVLVLFAGMSVVVTVLGVRDIKKMLARLASQASDKETDAGVDGSGDGVFEFVEPKER
ncbi:MAG: hypothetical protein VYB09_03375 [Planctomycetota bacterium]|nr:hypothetical protein [Planctomycetota bacterium]